MDRNIFSNLIVSLIDEGKAQSISASEIFEYLSFKKNSSDLEKRFRQGDIFNSEDSQILQVTEVDQAINRIATLVLDDIQALKDTNNWQYANRISRFLKEHNFSHVRFCEEVISKVVDGGLSTATFSRVLSALRSGKSISRARERTLNSIIDFINGYETNRSIINSKDVYNYLNKRLDIKSLTAPEINNICGDYLLFKRCNFTEGTSRRELAITLISIFRDGKKQVKFSYRIEELGGNNYLVEGIVVRDTKNSIKLVGFKKQNATIHSLQMISLSVGIEDLETPNIKKYINGGVFENEQSDDKPYHTWVHLSKVDNIAELSRKIDSLYESSDLKFSEGMVTIDFHKFNADSDLVNIVNDYIKGNYRPGPVTTLRSVDYIRRKLFLDEEKVSIDIL